MAGGVKEEETDEFNREYMASSATAYDAAAGLVPVAKL